MDGRKVLLPVNPTIRRCDQEWLLRGKSLIHRQSGRAASRRFRRAARLGLAGTMITEYPLEHRRYDQSEYEPFWAAAASLDLPLSLHTATRRQGRIRGVGDKT